MGKASRVATGLAGFVCVVLAAGPTASAGTTKYFYDGQYKAERVSGRINGMVELAYDSQGKRTEKILSGGLITPEIVDSTLTLEIHADIQRVYFLWGDGQRDNWENRQRGQKDSHSFIHRYLWNGDFLCEIYLVSLEGETKQYTAKITITGM